MIAVFHRRLKSLVAFIAFILCLPSSAQALVHLEGQEALDYIGDKKERLTTGGYTYEILKRSHRDTMNGRFSDAVLFNPNGDRFQYVKRTDGHHKIIVNHPEGRVEDPVTAEPLIWRPIANALSDDHELAHVFLDDNKTELGIVYIGRKTQLIAETNDAGLLQLEIKVKAGDRGKTARMKRKRL